MKLLSLFLLCPTCLAQTATTTPKVIATGQPTPTQNVVITVNGKKVSFLLSPANIPPLPVNIPALSLATPITASFTCTIPPSSTVIANPDGSKTITGVVCTLVTR